MKTRYVADERGVWRRADFRGINYSDGGEVEARLLRIISGARRVDTFAPELNSAITDWPSEYHLSRARHCLLRPLDIRPGDRILELGCGCGALTRYLGETGAEVIAVDGSLARTSIAVSRCRDLPNVNVFCDDLIGFETDAHFDWVILVGVLEYAPLFSKSPLPVEHYINSAGRFLAPEGQLVVAIENQLGLKYFNGCAEDHVGLPFFGVEHLYGPRSPVTYGRQELARRMQSCGFSALDWFYPSPDYKLPTVVVSSRAYETPGFGVTDLLARAQSRDYTGNRMRLFDEALACSALERNGLIEDLSNSFLLLARRGTASPRPSNSIAWTFAVHRREEFITQTAFIPDGQHIRVEKARLSSPCQTGDKSGEHARLRHSLESAAYTPGRLSVWRILEAHARSAPPEELVDAFLPWFDELLRHAAPTSVSEAGAISKPGRLIDYEVDGGMIDLTPFNLIEHDAGVSVIDQEWEWSGKLPLGQVVCRSVLHSLSLPLARGQPYDLADIVKRLCARRQLSVECEEVAAWLAGELEFLTAVGAPVPPESSFDAGRGHLIAVYPELVKRIGEASTLSAKITCVLAEHAAQSAQIESQIAENAATKAELEARLSECVDEISALHQVRGSQAAMISALTRDLSDQAAAIEAASRRDESQTLAGELNTARALLEYTHRELEAAQQSATTLAEAHRQLLASTSWRITAPLRVARTEARQIGGRVRSGIRRFLKNAPGNAVRRQF